MRAALYASKGVAMMQVFVCICRSCSGSSAWHTIRQLTFISTARRAIAGCSPHDDDGVLAFKEQIFVLLRQRNRHLAAHAVDQIPPASLMFLPSRTLSRLKIGRFSA